MPRNSIFADKGPAAFVRDDDPSTILGLAALLNSSPFRFLVSLQLARTELAQSFEVGVIQQTPVPALDARNCAKLASLARQSWSLMRTLDTTRELSHAFLLPAALLPHLGEYSRPTIAIALQHARTEIDRIAFALFGFDERDRGSLTDWSGADVSHIPPCETADEDEDNQPEAIDDLFAILSWCVGVVFGRFDWRLATGEREAPPEPDPFDPLPAKSPGMLPDGVAPFHAHPGILVDDAGHRHDLPRLMEDVLTTVDHPAPEDARRWLRRDFFPHHLKQYSKSRRKAPIYWPLSTSSGAYTLWLHYPALTDQTLYVTANDFVGPKLEETSRLARALRTRTDRSRDEERQLEQLQDLEAELKELQDELLRLAPTWKPDHDDGVQITAAPLWRLFRYRPWQTMLKETWEKLEKGDYDWAHLAMSYWPERVREKCQTDRSLAIAHDLESLYKPSPENPGSIRRGRRRAVEGA
jgi:hypothetical protein